MLHQQQETIDVDKTKLFQTTACLHLGVCVCKKPEMLKMERALVRTLKGFFVNVNKKPSRQRHLLRSWKVVLRLHTGTDARVHQHIYLHVGAANFTTWELGCLRLEEFCATDKELTLKVPVAVGSTPLDVRTLLAFLVSSADAAEPWAVECYKIIYDRAPIELEMMHPQYVAVLAEPLMPSTQYWSGSDRKRKRSGRESWLVRVMQLNVGHRV